MKILLIAEYIAPVNAIASIRWTKLSKYLTLRHRFSIDVLTNEKNLTGTKLLSENYLIDPTLRDDTSFFCNVFTVPDGMKLKAIHGIHNCLRYAKNKVSKIEKGKKQSLSSTSSDDNVCNKLTELSSFRNGLIRAIDDSHCERANKVDIDFSLYDVVISTCGPRWTHRIAAIIKKSDPTIKWIADYRDSLVSSNVADTEENRSFASRVTGSADCVTSVSKGVANLLFLDPFQRSEVLTNGYDPDDTILRKRFKSDKFELTYTGTLYDEGDGRRDLSPLFRALTELLKKSSIPRDDVIVRYAGGTEDIFLRQASCFSDVPVESVGFVSRDKAIKMQSSASLLIFSTWNTSLQKGGVTGKIFEYLTSGVPIVGVSSGDSPDSEAKRIIEDVHAGFCYEEASDSSDYIQLVDFVHQSYVQWKNQGLTSCNIDSNCISRFSYLTLADQLAEIINTLTETKENCEDDQ